MSDRLGLVMFTLSGRMYRNVLIATHLNNLNLDLYFKYYYFLLANET